MSWLTRRLLGRSEGPGRETRQGQPFTDAIVAAILEANTGVAASHDCDGGSGGGREPAGAFVCRCKGVTPDNELTASLSPAVLNLIARDLIRRGESLWVIGVSEGAVSLHPAGSWDVRGDPVGHGRGESGWHYRLDLFGPSSNVTRYLPASAVLHFRYSVDVASRPWQGLSPIAMGLARAPGSNAEAERSLADESRGASRPDC